jgi:hypothetical protein
VGASRQLFPHDTLGGDFYRADRKPLNLKSMEDADREPGRSVE